MDDNKSWGARLACQLIYPVEDTSLFDQLVPFLILASIGAPLFALWVLREYISINKQSA